MKNEKIKIESRELQDDVLEIANTREALEGRAGTWIKYWARRLWRNGGWIVILINVFIIWIPTYYMWTADIPSPENWQRTDGVLVYKKLRNLDNMPGLSSADGIEYFTCRHGSLSKINRCLSSNEMNSLDGKNTEIFWFTRNTYIFTPQKRVIRIVVEGQEKYGFERALRGVNYAKKGAFWMVLVLAAISIIVVRTYDKKIEEKRYE